MLISVLFALAAEAAIIRGTVSTGNVRLPGMMVEAYDTAGFLRDSDITNASGEYTLAVTAGTYRVLAYDPQGLYATSFHQNRESFEQSNPVSVSEGSPADVHFQLVFGGRISGTVTAANAPLADAVVEVYNLSGSRRGFTRTNAAGQFSLVVPPGEYRVFAYDANDFYAGEFHSNARAFSEANGVQVQSGGTSTVVFALEPAAHLSGNVLDAQTRAGIPGMQVYVYTAGGALVATKTTDAQGHFRFTLQAGQYRIVSGGGAYGPAFWVEARSFAQAEVLTLGPGVDRQNVLLVAERGATIRGDATLGAFVTAYNLDGSVHARTQADSFGNYSLTVAPGRYKLAVEPLFQHAAQFYGDTPDFESAQVIAIIGGQTLTIDFHPPRAGTFTGFVRDAQTQQPLGGITVAAYDANGARVAETITNAVSTYQLRVAPGEYRVVAYDTRLEYATSYAPAPWPVAVDQSVTVDFTMRRGTRVSGSVLQPGGHGAEGVEVLAFDLAGNQAAGATTDASGAFTLVVVPGTYTFEARTRFSRVTHGPIDVGGTSPALIGFTLEGGGRRRSARH
ncbi:MAG TPA: carboxypeptidase regulatory-like domain-containing protein [Thermoanaerobaculia bacterium]